MWKISVQYDADQNDVGTVSGTWTDPNLDYGIFTFSKRIKATTAGVNSFVAEAIAARNVWQVKQEANVAGAIFVLNKINTTDPKVEV